MDIPPLPSINPAHLQTLLLRVTSRPGLINADYSIERLAGGTGEGSQGIYWLSGTGMDQGQAVPWSLILKILVPPDDLSSQAVHSPTGFAYWKREAAALASGLLKDLPTGLSAPRCYEVSPQPDGAVWLWMEKVHKDPAGWTTSRYAETARLLGAWQGQYLNGKPLPEADWLTPRTWNRDFVEENRETIKLLQRSLDKPWVRYAYPPEKLGELLWAWQEREVFYRILENLPQVFCHRDIFGRNLMDRAGDGAGRPETVLIDWAYAGIGALGEELVPLVQATSLWGEVERGTYPELEEAVLSGYVDGLREAGWRGDPRLVRLGYAAASALRYSIGTIRFGFLWLLDESTFPDDQNSVARETREMIDFWTETLCRHIFPLAREAYEQRDLILPKTCSQLDGEKEAQG
jgi:hypothetical protein